MDKWPKMFFLWFPIYCVYWNSRIWIIWSSPLQKKLDKLVVCLFVGEPSVT